MKKVFMVALLMTALVAAAAYAVGESNGRYEMRQYRDANNVDTLSVEYQVTFRLYEMCIHSDMFGAMPYGIAEIAVKELPTIDEMNVVIEWAMLADCFDDTVGETDEYCEWAEMMEERI